MFYKRNNNYEPVDFFVEVHNKISSRYLLTKNIKNDDQKAKIMEEFFQKLKNYYMSKSSSKNQTINELDQKFFDEIEKRTAGKGESIQDFFKALGTDNKDGVNFEQYIGRIVLTALTGQGVTSNDTAESIKTQGAKVINITGQSKTYGSKNMQRFLEESIEVTLDGKNNSHIIQLKEKISDQVKEYTALTASESIKQAFPKTAKKVEDDKYKPYFTAVDQKVDMNNNEIKVQTWIELTNQTKEALKLIQKAAFTIKSYKKGHNIKIGDTNPIRAFFSALESIGINDYKTLSSGFLHSFALLNLLENSTGNSDQQYIAANIAPHIYHLRFIYELIGIGQKKSDLTDLANADFLLYNQNNASGIYVYSTKLITRDLFDSIENYNSFRRLNPFKGSMYIKLEYLRHLT